MSHYVLDARIYFSDEGNAENAYNHLKALAEHSAAHDVAVGVESESSWARLHNCKAEENQGDTSQCTNIVMFVLNEAQEPEEPGVTPEWQPGLEVLVDEQYTYEGITYKVLQAHTTQEGWEPDVTPALWEVV